MSRLPTALANAQKGSELRKRGFRSGIDANPDFKQYLITEWKKGTQVDTIWDDAANKWGKENIPSKTATYNWVKRHLPKEVEHDVVELSNKYIERMKEFDGYLHMLELAEEMWTRYTDFKTKEKQLNLPMASIQRELLAYRDTLRMIVELEIKLGLRAGIADGQTNNFNQFNITNGGPMADLEAIDEQSVEELDRVIEFRNQVDSYREQRAERIAPEAEVVDSDQFSPVQSRNTRVHE